jgi:hypothetical protein
MRDEAGNAAQDGARQGELGGPETGARVVEDIGAEVTLNEAPPVRAGDGSGDAASVGAGNAALDGPWQGTQVRAGGTV